jgi:hypothetical protein
MYCSSRAVLENSIMYHQPPVCEWDLTIPPSSPPQSEVRKLDERIQKYIRDIQRSDEESNSYAMASS